MPQSTRTATPMTVINLHKSSRRISGASRLQRPVFGASAESNALLSINDLSERLGVPVQTIYQWRTKHVGPRAMRVGRYLRWHNKEIEAWLLTQLDDWDVDYNEAVQA